MMIPATRYRDPETALAFLRDVLGLAELAIHRDAAGRLVHAEMRLGQGVMMLGPETDNAFAAYMVHPDRTGGRATVTIYAVVEDVAAVHDRAVAAGARILMPLEAQEYGGSSFSLADPEGHVWTFGDYAPNG